MTDALGEADAQPSDRAVAYSRGLGRQILLYLPGQVLAPAIGFLAIPIITRVLDQTTLGTYYLLAATFTSITTFGTQWVYNSAVRFYMPMENRQPEFFLHLFVCLFLTFVAVSLVGLAAWPWLSEMYRLIVVMLAPVVCMTAITRALMGVLRARGQPIVFGLFHAGEALARHGGGVLCLLVISATASAYVLGWTVAQVAVLVAMLAVVGGLKGIRHARFSGATLKSFLVYGVPVMGVSLAAIAMTAFDRFAIDAIAGIEALGYYGVAFQLGASPIQFLGSGVMMAVFPTAVAAHESGGEELPRVMGKGLRLLVLSTVPILAIQFAMAEELLSIYAGPEFAQGAVALRIIALATFLISVAHYYRMPFLLVKSTLKLAAIGGICAAVSMVGNLALIPLMGYVGSAMAMILAYVTMILLAITWGRRMPQVPWPTSTLLRSAGIGAVVWLVATAIRRAGGLGNMTMVGAWSLGLLLAYLVLLYLTGEIRAETRQLLAAYARRFHRSSGSSWL